MLTAADHRLAQEAGKAKDDSGKVDLTYLLDLHDALIEVARVMQAGDKKYTELTGQSARGSWQNVPDGHRRYTAALMRHLMKESAELSDGDLDKWEPGIRHDAQVACNALFRLALALREDEEQS